MIGILALSLTSVVLLVAARAYRDQHPPSLGWMSERWLAENRAAHP
jgi:hypothetical protein